MKSRKKICQFMSNKHAQSPEQDLILFPVAKILSDLEALTRLENGQSETVDDGVEAKNSISGTDESALKQEENPFLDKPIISSPLGASRTPLKIRDNLSCMFGLKPEPVSQLTNQVTTGGGKFIHQEQSVFPVSRMMVLGSLERAVFKSQIEDLRTRTNEYFFYFKWVLWVKCVKPEPSHSDSERASGSILTAVQVIETNLDLSVAAKAIKEKLRNKNDTLIFFKLGLVPSKSSNSLLNGSTIKIRVASELSYDFYKSTSLIIMNDDLNSPDKLDVGVCGISHALTKTYSILSIWLHETPQPISTVYSFTERLQDLLPDHLRSSVRTAVLSANKDSASVPIYTDECDEE